MDIIAQATLGASQFLHPDYVSAANNPRYNYRIDFTDGIFSAGEIYLVTFSLVGIIILGVLIAHFIGVVRKRF
ncbi:MAG: hypothetical protein ACFFE5_13675 [Candidatus Thorarchaeota archaeon]